MTIDYTFDDLVAGGTDVKGAVEAILREVENLQTFIGKAYADWESESARGAYQTLQTNWDSTEDQIRAALAKFGVAIDNAGIEMKITEGHNAGILGG